MKRILISSLLWMLILPALSAQYRTDRTGYEGDYFSLEGALELFQDARTLRDFERKLNTQDRWVNNLDLDYDGRTDYIRVEHRRQGDFHLVILQAIVGRYDIQDVAVIEIERIGSRDAVLQIIGDEDLYGREAYVEPVIGYANSRTSRHSNYGEYVNVYYWPIVQYMFGPQYRQVYVSPYRYSYYPTWWTAWRPVTWNVFRPRIVVYTRRFRVAPRLRVVRAHRFYRPNRAYCYDVVVRSNRVRVRNGRPPINRPRYNNQNRFNDRGGRPGRDFRDRPGVADRSADRARTAPGTARRQDRSNNRSISPQSDRNASRRPADRSISNERRSGRDFRSAPKISDRNSSSRERPQMRQSDSRRSNNTRTFPSTEKRSNERVAPRMNPSTRNSTSRQQPNRSIRQERSTPTPRRNSPAVRQKQSGPSRSSGVKSRTSAPSSRSVRPSTRSSRAPAKVNTRSSRASSAKRSGASSRKSSTQRKKN